MCALARKEFAVMAVFLLSAHLVMPVVAAASEEISIPVGTVIMLAFEGTVNPTTEQVGQKVFLRVTEPVQVDGKVVIAEGARAIGEVTNAQKKGWVGKPAIVGVRVRSVEAVDGTMIPASGTKYIEGENNLTESLVITILCCVLGLMIKGGDAAIPEGSMMEATVDIATPVEITS